MFPDNKIFHFNTEKIKLKKFILNIFKVNTIDQIFNLNDNKKIYEILYSNVYNKKFQEIFYNLQKLISLEINEDFFYYQKIPSFRIQRPGDKSVNFHNDIWYGHGNEVINFWIPITKLSKSNTVWLTNSHQSIILNKQFKEKKLSIDHVNNLAKKISEPFIGNYGQILAFNTSTFHGTVKNNSKQFRLSFDFRILLKGKSAGTKPLNEFYNIFSNKKIKTKKEKKITKKSIFYMFKKNIFLNNLSHTVQREIINSYATSNNFVGFVEETEIHGVDHYPHLDYYIQKSKIKDIILTSLFCLPINKKLRNLLINKAEKFNKNIHFALENTNTKIIKIAEINKYYEKVNLAYNNFNVK